MLIVNLERYGELKELLTEFKDAFLPELPKVSLPNRELGNSHRIKIKEGIDPIHYPMYRHSP